MKVLHLYSDFRWTGPAEPTVRLVRDLCAAGIDVTFACGSPPKPYRGSILAKAPSADVTPDTSLRLSRYNNPVHTLHDLTKLPRYLAQNKIDIVHTHLTHDHVLGAMAARLCRPHSVKLVRTNHKGVPINRTLPHRLLLTHGVDAYVGFSPLAASQDCQSMAIDDANLCIINPAIDLERFHPAEPPPELRTSMELGPDDVVAGVIARVQRHRRFEILLEAIALAKDRAPNLRMLIVGRGRALKEVAKDPAERMGLTDVVKFAGYRREDYVDVVRSIDFLTFLMPGSDGTCRAVREAMACGKPVVAARRGMLPELVPDRRAGLVVDDTPENLADAMVEIAQNHSMRRELGTEARSHALTNFAQQDQTKKVLALYHRLMNKPATAEISVPRPVPSPSTRPRPAIKNESPVL